MSDIKTGIEKTLDTAEKLNETLNSFLSIEREYAQTSGKVEKCTVGKSTSARRGNCRQR